jgi:hypothetical protein
MIGKLIPIIAALLLAFGAYAEEPEADSEETTTEAADATPVDDVSDVDEGGPKTMSGMSILGNEEAPKSLVIIPWKSSEIGADLGLSDTLDDRARAVDKEVFLRELSFYEIRSGEQ